MKLVQDNAFVAKISIVKKILASDWSVAETLNCAYTHFKAVTITLNDKAFKA